MQAQPHLTTAPTAAIAGRTMRALAHRRYGAPGVLSLEDVPRPSPRPDEVLVKVHAANVSIGDHHVINGTPYLVRVTPYGGLPGPRNLVPGTTLSGVVEEVGAQVTAFEVGDEVFGEVGHGAFAEYAAAPARALASKPRALSLEDAAAVPWAMAALQGLRDAGNLQAGQKVLLNGASGAVGNWAVQLARHLGAHVTAVCSTRNVERVRALGADEVIDYTKADFLQGGARFDVVFDAVGNRSVAEFRSALTPTGTYVACGGGGSTWFGPLGRIVWMMLCSPFTKQRLKPLLAEPNAKDLALLAEWIDGGHLRPVIERRLPLARAVEALQHVGEGHAQGATLITMTS